MLDLLNLTYSKVEVVLIPKGSKILQVIASDKILADSAQILLLLKGVILSSYNTFISNPVPLGVQVLTTMEGGTLKNYPL